MNPRDRIGPDTEWPTPKPKARPAPVRKAETRQQCRELIAEWRRDGATYPEIAARLNELGIRPPKADEWCSALVGLACRRILSADERQEIMLRFRGRRSVTLNEHAVREIRRRHAEGERATVLANEYGVSQSTMSSVVRGITWAHVA